MSPHLHPYLTALFFCLVVLWARVALLVDKKESTWSAWLWLSFGGGLFALVCMFCGWWWLNYYAYWVFLLAKHVVVAVMICELMAKRLPRRLPDALPTMAGIVMLTLISTPAFIQLHSANSPNRSELLLLANAAAVWMALPLWIVAKVCRLTREQSLAVRGFVWLYSFELIAMALMRAIPFTRPQAWVLQMGSELVVMAWWWMELREETA